LLASLRRLLEPHRDVFGIDDRDDAGQRELAPDAFVGIDALRDRSRLGQTGGLDDHGVELVAMLHDLEEAAHQIAAHRAADTAIVHLHHLLIGGEQQMMVYCDLSELIDDHGDAAAMLGGQDAIEQRGFARAEKAGQDDDRSFGIRACRL
jgi:hypothetical protein